MKNVKMRKLHVYRLTSFVVIKKVAGGVFDGGSNVVNYNGKALFVFQGGVGIIFHNEQAPFLFCFRRQIQTFGSGFWSSVNISSFQADFYVSSVQLLLSVKHKNEKNTIEIRNTVCENDKKTREICH